MRLKRKRKPKRAGEDRWYHVALDLFFDMATNIGLALMFWD